MALNAKSKLYRSANRTVLYIPCDIAGDSQFPFKTSTIVGMRIEGDRLVIEREGQ